MLQSVEEAKTKFSLKNSKCPIKESLEMGPKRQLYFRCLNRLSERERFRKLLQQSKILELLANFAEKYSQLSNLMVDSLDVEKEKKLKVPFVELIANSLVGKEELEILEGSILSNEPTGKNRSFCR